MAELLGGDVGDQVVERPRLLATASVGSEAELRSRPLRQDLLDRLAVHVVRVPPLRERVDEIHDTEKVRDAFEAFRARLPEGAAS